MDDLRKGITLGAMLYSEQRGDYRTMRGQIKQHGGEVTEVGDIETLREFASLLMRVIVAIDKEAELGEGALINKHHPSYLEWPKIKSSPVVFATPNEIVPL